MMPILRPPRLKARVEIRPGLKKIGLSRERKKLVAIRIEYGIILFGRIIGHFNLGLS